MRTLQEKYNAVLEGNFSKAQFKRDASMELPQFISKVNSFDDAVSILKNKGMLAEAKKEEPKYSTASPEDTIAPDVLDTGIKFELDKKFGTLDVSDEDYKKAKETAIKNLSKDVLYYVKKDSEQLETPKEEMEKVKVVKEDKEEDEYYDKLAAEKDAKHDRAQDEYEKIDASLEEEEEAGVDVVKHTAKLTNELLSANPEDVDVKAFAIQVKNDLESGDSSRLTKYKGIRTTEDLEELMRKDLNEDHSSNPNDKYVVRPCKNKKEPWAVWEGEVRVKGFATKEEAQAYADKQNKEQGLKEDYDNESIREGLAELERILEELEDLERDATSVLRIFFPSYLKKAQAYGALNFGISSNPHDTTLASITDEIRNDKGALKEGEWKDKGQSAELNKERLEALKAKKAKLEKDGAPKGAIATIDKQIGELEKLVSEVDNSDYAMRVRAMKNKKPSAPKAPKANPNADKIAKLKQHKAQIMRDMEQEAEPAGGPIADKYGDMLNKIDKAIAQLQGTEKEREYKLMRESSIHSTEVEFILPIMHDKLGHPTERPAQSEIIDAAYEALSDWYPGDEVDVRHVEQLEKAYYADFDELVANTPDHSDYEMYENKKKDLKEMFKKIIAKVINE